MSTKSHRLTAADLMQKEVVRIDADATTEEAAAILEDAGIGGAPVLDATGRVIGVVSLRDLAPRARLADRERDRGRGWGEDDLDTGEAIEDEISMIDDYSPQNAASERVRDVMSPGAITVAPSMTVRDVAARMVAEKIHRVFVVEGGKLRGVISTFDVARAVADGLV
ncbi:MAG: CBS domain-containing protein [Planctomycetes bacterium]|nr:CBS domain-containing protein [Planctomycetota bacterium]